MLLMATVSGLLCYQPSFCAVMLSAVVYCCYVDGCCLECNANFSVLLFEAALVLLRTVLAVFCVAGHYKSDACLL